jgi:hypothetical protein
LFVQKERDTTTEVQKQHQNTERKATMPAIFYLVIEMAMELTAAVKQEL